MNKKIHITYISLIVVIVIGFSFSIKEVQDERDDRCWEMIKKMSESKGI
ncbi:hypothetical protein N8209_01430 [Gammaproteobacteria bacterium]|nr:hypothetical protein [Gammaproteobacteria bacterium]